MINWKFKVYPDNTDAMLAEFRCDNGPDGEIVECQETFDRFLTASNWVCNSNWALQDRIIKYEFLSIIFSYR